MSRLTANDREDPHARFTTWVMDGADGALPRDVLVHAAYCDDCRRTITALDALARVDPGTAPMPPTHPQAPSVARPAPSFVARALATGGLIVAVTGALVGGIGALPAVLGGPAETPVQQVLGGTGRPSPSPSPTLAPEVTAQPS